MILWSHKQNLPCGSLYDVLAYDQTYNTLIPQLFKILHIHIILLRVHEYDKYIYQPDCFEEANSR